jgi:uncharacterized protein DUF5658
MDLAFFLLYIAAVLAFMSDAILTIKGLDRGFKEANPLIRFLFSKMDKALAIFLSGLAITGLAALVNYLNEGASLLFLGIVAVGEGIQAVKNYRLLRK